MSEGEVLTGLAAAHEWAASAERQNDGADPAITDLVCAVRALIAHARDTGSSAASPAPRAPTGVVTAEVERAIAEMLTELLNAQRDWPTWHTAHEGYGLLSEEFEEVKEHIFMHPRRRDVEAMRREAIQLAACALRFVVEICDGGRGRL